jgi:hypothetical protein
LNKDESNSSHEREMKKKPALPSDPNDPRQLNLLDILAAPSAGKETERPAEEK